jgi:hypothetical protein
MVTDTVMDGDAQLPLLSQSRTGCPWLGEAVELELGGHVACGAGRAGAGEWIVAVGKQPWSWGWGEGLPPACPGVSGVGDCSVSFLPAGLVVHWTGLRSAVKCREWLCAWVRIGPYGIDASCCAF